jgi:hypothetical protein
MKKITILVLALSLASELLAQNQSVPYPDGYKEYKHIKTLIMKPEHPQADIFAGIHHIYANDKAYKGYKNGSFEDGSIIVLDYLKYEDANHTIYETSRNYVAVMYKDEKKYKDTKGWGYEAFEGNSKDKRLVNDVNKMCFSCHLPQKRSDYVFSKIRE